MKQIYALEQDRNRKWVELSPAWSNTKRAFSDLSKFKVWLESLAEEKYATVWISWHDGDYNWSTIRYSDEQFDRWAKDIHEREMIFFDVQEMQRGERVDFTYRLITLELDPTIT